MTDDDKALIKRLREADDWYFDESWERETVPSDAPFEAADRIEAQAAEIEQLREALGLFDDLIKHQYSGSREAMSDMTYAAQNAARVLKRGAWAALGETE